MASSFPRIDFNKTSLSKASRRQLAEIAKTISRPNGGAGRTGLQNLILRNVFDQKRGIYVPLSDTVYVEGKFPKLSQTLVGGAQNGALTPFPAFFGNALLIPVGYGSPDFRPDQAPSPKERATNVGFLVVTIEFDCKNADQFEENLAWTRSSIKDGDFSKSPLAQLDRELRRVREYRGFSAVFSGGKSVHFHFLISTAHLLNAPCEALAPQRLRDFRQTSALLHNAHQLYWDHVHETFVRILKPSIPADRKLRSLTLWRRSPWGVRAAEQYSLLRFLTGTPVPQLVIREKILERAPKGNSGFLVPEFFSLASPVRKTTPGANSLTHDVAELEDSSMLELLEEVCFAEWGEWPKPSIIGIQKGEWLFRFRNHEADRNPSTIALGGHRQLQLNGRHDFGDRQFYLPDQMTTQDLGNHLAERLGWQPQDSEGQGNPLVLEQVTVADRKRAIRDYRAILRREVAQRSDLGMVSLVVSVEGIGKTTAHLNILASEALEDALAHEDEVERFSAFAFRSRNQANEKAREFDRTNRVRVIKTFWEHYSDACQAENQGAIPRDEFDDAKPSDILGQIRKFQPNVFGRLERDRLELWIAPARFDGGCTLLCLTHRAAQLWHSSVLTRAWHHPEFEPLGPHEQHAALRGRFRLNRIVLDDCEAEDFIHILPVTTYDFLSAQQQRHADWRNIPRTQRMAVYRRLRDEIPGRRITDFDSFDEMMRLDLATLEPVTVDFNAIPFGYDNTETGIYRQRHGDQYLIGPKPWLTDNTAEFTFLTTESLVATVIEGAFQKIAPRGRGAGRQVIQFALDRVPPIYPVKVPVKFDRRAGADRNRDRRISALAAELVSGNADAIVIADGVNGVQNVTTFQGMKGQNGLADKDVYIIPTCLAPEKFAELNVIGRWLGIDDVIDRHYDDQLNQAVGRNRGFRLSERSPTATQVVTSSRLWHQVLKRNNGHRRAMLFIA